MIAALVVAAGAFAGPSATPVLGATCGANPRCFSNATVSPGSGTTATSFTFSVHYQDDFNRALSSAVVNVAGVGPFTLSPSA